MISSSLPTMAFIFVVGMVCSLVFNYSTFYLREYNNFKFFYLTFLFFSSMILLVTRNRIINIMLGWDMLGISSLCLIMFYPNKNTLFNSFLTLMYNRLGDVLLIVTFCAMISSQVSFLSSLSVNPLYSCLLIFLCTFTKRAQIPISSWLPAAISAPTPISAMVHSSTLVKAGIFLVFISLDSFHHMNFIWFLLSISLLTFLRGGFLARIDLDFKKIVAFSTISQVSLILVMLSSNTG